MRRLLLVLLPFVPLTGCYYYPHPYSDYPPRRPPPPPPRYYPDQPPPPPQYYPDSK
ncbi:MAG: hypothetical protein JO110_16680 [Acetobacteraceae bacterium]|nr:hypothetical protein [Acetobacteraceae bacterium]